MKDRDKAINMDKRNPQKMRKYEKKMPRGSLISAEREKDVAFMK